VNFFSEFVLTFDRSRPRFISTLDRSHRGLPKDRIDVLQGTLDLLILRTLVLGPLHGLGVSRRIEQITRGAFRVRPGSLFPALHRLEQEGYLEGEWGQSENRRSAKYYRLTATGRGQLETEKENWQQVVSAVARVLEAK